MSTVDRIAMCVLFGVAGAIIGMGIQHWDKTGEYPGDATRQLLITLLLMVVVWRKRDRSER